VSDARTTAPPLEPDPEQWRALAEATVDHLSAVLRDLPNAPASMPEGAVELLADPALRRPPPEEGRPLGELLAVLDPSATPWSKVPSAANLALRSSTHCTGVRSSGNGIPASTRHSASPRTVRRCQAMMRSTSSVVPVNFS
jgi:hypothetical protein